MRRHDRPVLHDRDGSHPTLAGTFLAACVAYATLFGRKTFALPEGIVELTEGDKKILGLWIAKMQRMSFEAGIRIGLAVRLADPMEGIEELGDYDGYDM